MSNPQPQPQPQPQPGFFTKNLNKLQNVYNNNQGNIWNTAKAVGSVAGLQGYGAAKVGMDAAKAGWNRFRQNAGQQWTRYQQARNNIKNFADAKNHFNRGGPPADTPRAQVEPITPQPQPQPQPQWPIQQEDNIKMNRIA